MGRYGPVFFQHVTRTALASARVVLPLVRDLVAPASVADFGCGEGAWLSVWRELGIREVAGVDGAAIDPDRLLIPRQGFVVADLSRPLDLGRRFDLVESLEVGEHLPEAAAGVYVDTLVRHGPAILFSAAVSGQGGHDHVNERPYDYWRALFADRGLEPLDPFRGALARDRRVNPWYRYNLLLYVEESWLEERPELAVHRIEAAAPIPDVAPPSYRLRRTILRRMPPWLLTRGAQLKEAASLARLRITGR